MVRTNIIFESEVSKSNLTLTGLLDENYQWTWTDKIGPVQITMGEFGK